jgi:hypothetical protein
LSNTGYFFTIKQQFVSHYIKIISTIHQSNPHISINHCLQIKLRLRFTNFFSTYSQYKYITFIIFCIPKSGNFTTVRKSKYYYTILRSKTFFKFVDNIKLNVLQNLFTDLTLDRFFTLAVGRIASINYGFLIFPSFK